MNLRDDDINDLFNNLGNNDNDKKHNDNLIDAFEGLYV